MNTYRVIKLRSFRLAAHVACVEETANGYENIITKQMVQKIWETIAAGGIILKLFLKEYSVRLWIGFVWLSVWSSGGFL
jgi:hypothetical protein